MRSVLVRIESQDLSRRTPTSSDRRHRWWDKVDDDVTGFQVQFLAIESKEDFVVVVG